LGWEEAILEDYIFKRLVEEEIKIPIQICNSHLKHIDDNSFFILSSYSGNTKEVIEEFNILKKIFKKYFNKCAQEEN
jgi:fructoselysine-6-P-deglycase FrlB-like protein